MWVSVGLAFSVRPLCCWAGSGSRLRLYVWLPLPRLWAACAFLSFFEEHHIPHFLCPGDF
jgi:hypothetical protein